MPTTHVGPESQEALQDIANGLLRARKVIVVTGAGISTNSGIPDFRSENGLYSLIQAQFDAAAQQARQAGAQSDNETSDVDNGRASKRRKLSVDDAPSTEEETSIIKDEIEVQGEESDPDSEVIADTIQVEGDPDDQEEVNGTRTPLVNARTTRSTIVAQPMTSPLSSPPPEDLNIPLSAFRRSRHDHLADVGVPPSSSPLSSPPPVLFDPFSNMPSEGSPSRRCSTSPSEVDDTPPSNPISSSQPSLGPGRNTLPNMKGKDLFDASIWADPIRTSVFYTFATTLRQKVKDVEPTSSHRFISHLRNRGKLVRCYTQNIDQIEEKVGLSTCLSDGPGSRGRFSRKSTANLNQLNKMVDEVAGSADSSSSEKPHPSSDTEATRSQKSQSQSDGTTTPPQGEPDQPQSQPETSKAPAKNARREMPKSGVECVFLHGSLELLRCFLCGRVCSWDDQDRELETMSGQQPECPHCVGATTAREERGKRALGVGKLRPDIVLYGEEHPNAHLISPIVTHDLALCPDLLLILGTSLRVHGLKVMVREFAKAVHAKGGKVVFVNFTKPPESSWGDIIDYWIEWDCDAWVADLHDKVPKLWQAPEPPKPKKKRESSGLTEDGEKTETKRPPAAYPVALRDTKATGAYCTLKILKELHRISGHQPPARRASMSAAVVETTTVTTTVATAENKTEKVVEKTADTPVSASSETPLSSSPSKPKPRTRARRPRKSAPANLGRSKATPSTLNPNHGRTRRNAEPIEPPQPAAPVPTPVSVPAPFELANPITITPERLSLVKSSILESVKSKPRVRKRKKIDGEEVVMPTVGKRRTTQKSPEVVEAELGPIQLPPLKPQPPSPISSPFGRPVPMEPSLFAQGYNTQNKCSETGQLQSISPVSTQKEPLTSMSINMRRPMPFTRSQAFAMGNSSAHQNPSTPPQVEKPREMWFATPEDVSIVVKRDSTLEEREAILALTRLSQGHPRDPPPASVMVPETRGVQTRSSARLMELCSAAGNAEGELRSWGGRWNTNR